MAIQSDDVFIYPTDTVWGIGCSLYSEKGHTRIAEVKRTDKTKPLSIMFSSVKEIYESFQFPKEITLEWLRIFFGLETTLGLPLKISKIKIPPFATGESEFVSLRCLENDEIIQKIYKDLKTPFFTTSLNLTGESPIVSEELAFNFFKKYASDTHFFKAPHKTDLSGQSSTIVFLSENFDYKILREGRRVQDVKEHLKFL